MHRSRPGFIPRPLLHKAQLSERRARSAEVLLADSIVAARLGDFTVVATSPTKVAEAPLVEPQEADTAKHRYQISLI
jgi:hypothetical protein